MREFATVLLVVLLAAPSPAATQVTELISRNSAQEPADSHSFHPALSADGRYVAFDSWAGNLRDGVDVTNSGVFVRDLTAGATILASTAGAAAPNGKSYMATISGDGRYVAFWSQASNLIPGDTNGEEDLFVYDRTTSTVERVDVSTAGAQADPGDDGGHIVGDGPSLSADGRFVAFDSRAANLVPGDLNDVADVFVHDRQSGTTERVSLAFDGSEAPLPSRAPSISADGRFVAFVSQASLTPDDTNGSFDVYVYDRQGPVLQRIGVSAGSAPSLSADGRFVAFDSRATTLVPGSPTNGKSHVFVYDLALEQMTLASVTTAGTQGDSDSSEPSISADGRYVVFRSAASNLAAGDLNGADDVFIRDRSANVTARVSVLGSGVESDGVSRRPAVSADGHFIAFESAATTFGFGDDFGAVDLFLAAHDVCPGDAGDADADGTPDCHDPATFAALKLLVQQTRDAVRRMKPDRPERIVLAEQLREAAGWFRAVANNATLSTKQRKLVGAAATALTDLADASGKAMTRKRAKALGVLRKLLKASRA